MTNTDQTAEATPAITPAVVRPLSLPWGLQPPTEAVIAWGARAIYKLSHHDEKFFANGKRRKTPKSVTVACVDLLWDRQGSARDESAATVADLERFHKWLNKTALPALRKLCVKEYLTGDSEDEVMFASDGYTIKASPRASYGYLYIVAWKD